MAQADTQTVEVAPSKGGVILMCRDFLPLLILCLFALFPRVFAIFFSSEAFQRVDIPYSMCMSKFLNTLN